jgi:hypothetical protein
MGVSLDSNQPPLSCTARGGEGRSVRDPRANDRNAVEISATRVGCGLVRLAVAVAALTSLSARLSAIEKDEIAVHQRDLAGDEPEMVAKAEEKPAAAKIIDFVLAEVRKRLDPNPETEIVELKIDPDFHGADGTYLVNAVLDARGRKLTVGVMVSVEHTPEGMKTTMGYVD